MDTTTEVQTVNETQIVQHNFDQVLNPGVAAEIANTIKGYAVSQGLVSTIKGKKYPNVEAWQYAGLLMGLFPKVREVKNLSTEREFKYWAVVDIIEKSTGNIVSTGFGICSNKENTKKHFDEYAICSMAQTRATGKAFRLLVGWMFKLADLESTPSEEMEEENPNRETQGPSVKVIMKEYKEFAIEAIKCCVNAIDVRDLAQLAPTFMKHYPDAKVIDICREQFEELSKIGGDDEQ